MRRLYLEIYAAFLLIAALCVLTAGGLASLLFGDGPEVPPPARGLAAWVAESLPSPPLPSIERQRGDINSWNM